MNIIHNFISEELIYALGWTVVHSFWQALLIAMIMALVMLILPVQKAKSRYLMALASLALVLLCSVISFSLLYQNGFEQSHSGLVVVLADAVELEFYPSSGWAVWSSSFLDYFNEHLPLIVGVWFLGMSFFALRLMGGFAYVQHLKLQHNAPLSRHWQDRGRRLSYRLGLYKSVELMESALIKVPMAIGYFKPVILFPLGAINQLSPKEVEAILAHELAHIVRDDYLINIIQSIIEVLFYFNPAVWWISANVRRERENCCDDLAIKLSGDSLGYAKALLRLQELQPISPPMAMALIGSKNQLLGRIRRILNQPQNRSNIMEKCIATMVLLLAITIFSLNAKANYDSPVVHHQMEIVVPSELTPVEEIIVPKADTVPQVNGTIIHEADGRIVEITVRKGVIKKLIINGERIPDGQIEDYDELIAGILEDVPPPPPPPPPAPPVPPSPPVPLLLLPK